MIRECPHCYMTVLVQGGECPSCRKRVDDLSGTDATRTSLKIREGARLPSACAFCDAAEARLVAVSRVVRRGMPPEARGFLLVILALLGALSVAAVIVAPELLAYACALFLGGAYLALVLVPVFGWAAFALVLAASWWSDATGAQARGPRRVRVRVVIPLCKDCGRRPVEPLAVDPEEFAMTFIVDRRFAARAPT